MTALLDELADLDGEQLYQLVNELSRCETRALEAILTPGQRALVCGDLTALWSEFQELKLLALAQIARITVPIREAEKIIYRARYARTRPVRVPGT